MDSAANQQRSLYSKEDFDDMPIVWVLGKLFLCVKNKIFGHYNFTLSAILKKTEIERGVF